MNVPANSSMYLFVVYAPSGEDAALCSQLIKHLRFLEHEGLVRTFHSEQVRAGEHRKRALARHLLMADAVLVLYSADFVAFDLCLEIEGNALERARAGKLCVIPILLRPCDWGERDAAQLAALPSNRMPITQWPDRDAAFLDVAKGVRDALIRRNRGKTAAPMGRDAQEMALHNSQMASRTPPPPTYAQPRASYTPQSMPHAYHPASARMGYGSAPSYSIPPSRPQSAPALPRPTPTYPDPEDAPASDRGWKVGRFLLLVLLLSAGAAGLVFGAMYLLQARSDSESDPEPLFPTRVAASPPPAPNPRAGSPTPSPTMNPPAAPALFPPASPASPASSDACPANCCGGVLCLANTNNRRSPYSHCGPGKYCGACSSKRTCIDGLCSDPLPAGQNWLLRIAGYALTPDLQATSKRRFCMRKHRNPSTYTCFDLPSGAVDEDIATQHRLNVSTNDLVSPQGLDIWIFDGNTTIAEHLGINVGTDLKRTALCVGVMLKLPALPTARPASLTSLSFYLDDP